MNRKLRDDPERFKLNNLVGSNAVRRPKRRDRRLAAVAILLGALFALAIVTTIARH